MATDPRQTPDPSWRPQYHFAAAVRVEHAALYRPLIPGRYYPVGWGHPRGSLGLSHHWLAPGPDPETWVAVDHHHCDFLELVRGDAWEDGSGDIQPLDYPSPMPYPQPATPPR